MSWLKFILQIMLQPLDTKATAAQDTKIEQEFYFQLEKFDADHVAEKFKDVEKILTVLF